MLNVHRHTKIDFCAEQKPASLQFRTLHSAQCALHCAAQNWPVEACSTVVDGATWNAQENAFIK